MHFSSQKACYLNLTILFSYSNFFVSILTIYTLLQVLEGLL